MYLEYFGLTEKPFSIAPDPQYLYMSRRHKEAMAHLTYGLSQGGCFIVLTGEVGTGKTTLCRNLLEDLPASVDVALILNANINEEELLQTLCDELKIAYSVDNSQKQLRDLIYQHLLTRFAENVQTVLIIDEAQLLRRDVLEQIRLLTNLETTKSKLLQIILIGQPELNDLLGRKDLRQLAQRVTARYHLGTLPRDEIQDYVYFRLSVAGCRKPIFSKQALKQLHKSTDGIPRRINVLADHALLSTYSSNKVLVDAKTVKAASSEVFVQSSDKVKRKMPQKSWWLLFAIAVILLNASLWWWFVGRGSQDTASTAAQVESTDAAQGLTGQVQTDSAGQGLVSGDLDEASLTDSSTEPVLDPVEPLVGVGVGNSIDSNIEPAIEPTIGAPLASSDDGLTKIITSSDIEPGSVLIADELLDGEPVLVNPVAVPKKPSYDPNSDFGQLLEASADVTGRIAAQKTLAEAWDVSLPDKMLRSPCDELREAEIHCLTVSSWGRVTRLNRPTILVLSQGAQLHRVILFKLENQQAQVLVGENVAELPVSELRARWSQNGMLFWRPSGVKGEFLQEGDSSEDLPAVRTNLNRALAAVSMPLVENVSSTNFDSDLAQKVFALQSRFLILADGKIGEETYLLMNELLLPEATPVLTPRVTLPTES